MNQKTKVQRQPTTLYQNRSVSIINCEYKLKEKYPHMITLIFFFIIYITIILLGASLFMAFEAKAEQRLRDQIMNKQQLFLQQNQCVDSKELKQFIKSVIITYDKGVNLALLNDLVDTMLMTNNDGQSVNNDLMKKNVSKMIVENIIQDNNPENVIEEIIVTEQRKQPVIKQQQQQQLKSETEEEGQRVKTSTLIVPVQMSNWEFGSSMTYVASVVTTIGYGHVTPITNEGKILTIVFGAISIPCTLLFLSIIISMIRDGPIKQIEVWLIKLFGYFTDEITLLKIRFLHLFIVTIVLFSALIILPAFLFKQMESQWTFLDSFYYCFITITTVGLGDYVPGQNSMQENRTWYLISIVIYMYFGLCLMMLWIALNRTLMLTTTINQENHRHINNNNNNNFV
ncbi:Potassium channel sub K member 1 [Dermatophagoides pteronyssinus]|uniref:Potassium channel sub K member 1 n=1 Tax=Dermatophagoides pteronyssinus TaxID=6956 RepID=A0ABQ8JF92_DERPT|nr:Potassium channel sub K member 1 [Dermatophagoides pteronyssinus]